MIELINSRLYNSCYPDGRGELLAWDHSGSGRTSSTTYLLRGKSGCFVHYHIVDHTSSDSILDLSEGDAEYLFGRLKVQVMSGENAFS